MKLGVMQPYFYPYLGYFCLLNVCDNVIIYDDIKYTKKGWINRNRLNFSRKIETFSVPLIKSSDADLIQDKLISKEFDKLMNKTARKIEQSYSNYEFFDEVWTHFRPIFLKKHERLYNYLIDSLLITKQVLGIDCQIIKSSAFENATLAGQNRVIDFCLKTNATKYINLPGGKDLYSVLDFEKVGIELKFLDLTDLRSADSLSILDLLFRIGIDEVRMLMGTLSK